MDGGRVMPKFRLGAFDDDSVHNLASRSPLYFRQCCWPAHFVDQRLRDVRPCGFLDPYGQKSRFDIGTLLQ
jgi:hypothetical protein